MWQRHKAIRGNEYDGKNYYDRPFALGLYFGSSYRQSNCKKSKKYKLLWTFEIALPIIASPVLLINYDLRNGYNEASVIIARSIGGVLLGMALESHE